MFKYSSIHINLYRSEKSCFLWVFNHPRTVPHEYVCPFRRELTTSLITKTQSIGILKGFDPDRFFSSISITANDRRPKLVFIPDDMDLTIPDNWKTADDSIDIDKPAGLLDAEAAVLAKNCTDEKPNIIVRFSQRRGNYFTKEYYCDTDDELEEKKSSIIEGERYDDYWYTDDGDGNLSCNGISQKDDMDACEAFQERNPEKCRNCTNPYRVYVLNC